MRLIEILQPGAIFLASITIGGTVFLAALFWSSRREGRRGEERLAELVQLSHLESRRFWARDERFWQEWREKDEKQRERETQREAQQEKESREYKERADKRWADHELLMRMILERVDRERGQGNAG